MKAYKLLPIILLVLLASCTSKKSVTEFKDHLKYDSITYHSEKVIFPALKDTVFIKSPCDSLGVLKPFKQSFATPQGKIIIEGKNDQITANIDLKGTSTTDITASNTSKENTVDKTAEFERVIVQDWRLILVLVLSILLNLLLIYLKFFSN